MACFYRPSIFSKLILQTVTPLPSNSGIGFNTALFSDDSGETVEAQRRRRGVEGGPEGRAEMPGRPSSSGGESGGVPPSSSGRTPNSGFPSSGGSRMPGGKCGLPLWAIILIIALYLIYTLLSNRSSNPTETVEQQYTPPEVTEQAPEVPATAVVETIPVAISPTKPPFKPQPTTVKAQPTSAAQGPSKAWTIMLYQDADDPILEQDIYMDLNEAERVGSTDQVNVVAQIDRYAGAYQGDGDWNNTRRYYLTQDDDLFHVHSKMVGDMGETSMADPQTLIDFATWAIKTYPAQKYALILSDHGMGWPGGMTDPKPSARRSVDYLFSQALDKNMMYTNEIDQALGQIVKQTGIDRLEMVGMDACLMSHLEVYSALAPYTKYVVTSQETEPALGWAYAGFLKTLVEKPEMGGDELGKEVVSSFIVKDERILDRQARLDFLRQGSPLGGIFSSPADMDPAELSQEIGQSVTLTTARMDAVPALIKSLNQLVFAMQKDKQSTAATARTYAQSFTSIFGKEAPPSYIDLGSFAQLLQEESNALRL